MIHVPVGKVYEAGRPGLNLDVWLRASDGSWLDLDEKTFRECFEYWTDDRAVLKSAPR